MLYEVITKRVNGAVAEIDAGELGEIVAMQKSLAVEHRFTYLLGPIGSQAITNALTQFFSDMRELVAQPQSTANQQQTVWSAESLTEQFRNLGNFLIETGDSIRNRNNFV